MKKNILILLLMTGISSMVTAQNIRLNAYGAYAFDDGFDYYNSPTENFSGTVQGGFQWGFGAEFMVKRNKGIELRYLHQDATVPTTYYNSGVKTKTIDLGINYYLIGGSNYFRVENEKIEPYAGFSIGVADLRNNTAGQGSNSNRTAFAWGVKGGTNIWFSPKVGLKLQAELLSASAATGGAYYATWWGPVYANTYSSLYQFSLGGGLTFKLGK
jgi:hypothetical protein